MQLQNQTLIIAKSDFVAASSPTLTKVSDVIAKSQFQAAMPFGRIRYANSWALSPWFRQFQQRKMSIFFDFVSIWYAQALPYRVNTRVNPYRANPFKYNKLWIIKRNKQNQLFEHWIFIDLLMITMIFDYKNLPTIFGFISFLLFKIIFWISRNSDV